jgi:chemotaxis protein methyltransferase CheR
MREPLPADDIENLRLLLETVHEQSGFDFRDYAAPSILRRAARAAIELNCDGIAALHRRLREDPAALGRLLRLLPVHTTAMFRDPGFFLELREKVIPALSSHHFIRVWVAGCSTGEELYSVAILLREEGLAGRCRIYATDLSDEAVERARRGIFPISAMQDYSRNYRQAGGALPFSDYYTANSEHAVFHPELVERVVFATHNLASDASFNAFHLILCRNVMIYFNRDLQERVQRLLHQSLAVGGYLGLGRSETLRFAAVRTAYEPLDILERLLRKVSDSVPRASRP